MKASTLSIRSLIFLAVTASVSIPPGPAYGAKSVVTSCIATIKQWVDLFGGGATPETIITAHPLVLESSRFNHARASLDFAQHPRLLRQTQQSIDGGAFPASNEYDFYKTPFVQNERDLVVGFATNSAWDIAVRTNASVLVLADWQEGPLMGQEYLFRPLLLIAKNRADFLSMLAAVPLTPELRTATLEVLMNRLAKPSSVLPAERLAFVHTILTEVKADTRFSEAHVQFLARYFHFLMIRGAKALPATPGEASTDLLNNIIAGPAAANQAGPFQGTRIEQIASDLYSHFYERYHPQRLKARGADPEEIQHPFFSFLSSDAAFERLQKVFNNGVYYVQSSLFDPQLWTTVKKLATEKGLTRFAASISNIIDCSYGGCHSGPGTTKAAWKLISTALGPVDIYQTRGTKVPFTYEWIPLEGPHDVIRQLTNARYSDEEIKATPTSKATQVMRYIGSNEPTVSDVLTEEVHIQYGSHLQIVMKRPKPGSSDFTFDFHLVPKGEKPQIVFFDIPDDYKRASERVLVELGELRTSNEALNNFFTFHSTATTQP